MPVALTWGVVLGDAKPSSADLYRMARMLPATPAAQTTAMMLCGFIPAMTFDISSLVRGRREMRKSETVSGRTGLKACSLLDDIVSVGEPSRIFLRESDGDGVGDAILVGAGDLLV